MTPEEAALANAMKRELRKRMRGLRNTSTVESCRERSDRIVQKLWARIEEMSAMHVALFAAIEERHEIQLESLDRLCRERGIHVYYPSISESDDGTRKMVFRAAALGTLEERGLGFREPTPEDPEPRALDLVVVPALAVDDRGYRLGYGAGYYDHTLPRYCPPAKSIIVAYDYQLVVELPALPHDVACDAVFTDTRTFEPARG